MDHPGHISLPVEMFQAIVHEIPWTAVDDLLALRLVDRTFYFLAKDKAFRYLRIRNSPTGARRLLNFLESSSDLIGKVEKIRVAQSETDDEEEENYFTEVLVGTPKFPAVTSFEINLPDTAVVYQDIHISLLRTLLDLALPSIQSLTLTNWVPIHHRDYHNITFVPNPRLLPLLSSLKELEIAIRSYDFKDRSYHNRLPEPGHFWQHSLQAGILFPTQATLTSLVLASDMHVSLFAFDLKSLFFPRLETLSFRGISFSLFRGAVAFTTMERFIVRHRDTLKHLELHKCTIVRTSSSFRSWREVWLHFAAELDMLRELVVNEHGSSLYYERKIRHLRYRVLGESCFLADEAVSVHWDWEAEAEALQTLKVIVESRRGISIHT